MSVIYISSTDLKNKTAEILNLVSFGGIEVIIERHDRPLAKILPFKEEEKNQPQRKFEKVFWRSC